ncbi:MAG: type II toxin-antitoxin system Phd/YefM family antitoxin [Myxococcota bacterium]
MKVAPLFEVKNRLSQYVTDARRAPVIITRKGRPCAALVSLEDTDLEVFLLGHHPGFLALLDRSAARARAAGVTPLADVERLVARESGARAGRARRRRRA